METKARTGNLCPVWAFLRSLFVPLGRMCYTVLKDTVENEVQI